MNRRKFIKRGALWVTGAAAFGVITPRKSKAQPPVPPPFGYFNIENGAIAGPPPPPTPFLRWPINEGTGTTLNDISGNGLNGTLTSSFGALPIWASDDNAGNNAVSMEANATGSYNTNQGYAVSNSASIAQIGGLTQATICCWVSQSNLVSDSSVFGFAGGLGGQYLFCMNYNGGDGEIYSLVYNNYSGNNNFVIYSSFGYHHLAMTWNGAIPLITTYIDGASVGTLTTSVPASLGTAAQMGSVLLANGFGGRGGSDLNYAGKYQDLQIFNTALTASQVNAIYTAGPL